VPPGKTLRWYSILQFGISASFVAIFWGVGVILALVGVFQFFEGGMPEEFDISFLLFAAGMGFLGGLMLLAAYFSLMDSLGRNVRLPSWASWKNARKTIWLLPIIFFLGYFVAITPEVAWLLLPPLHVIAVGLPILWFLSLGGRNLAGGSPQSLLGVFSVGLVLAPIIVILLEILIGVIFLAFIIALLTEQPGFIDGLIELIETLRNSPMPTPEAMFPFFETYLVQSPIILIGLFFIGVMVPIVEEFFKPIGLLFLNGREITLMKGFVAGMLSGAAFALFETMFQVVQGREWILLVGGRMGTSLVHIVTTGIVGWGYALFMLERRFLRLAVHYLVAVIIHAIWNGMTTIFIVANLPGQNLLTNGFPWNEVTVISLALLMGFAFFALNGINLKLQKRQLRKIEPVRSDSRKNDLDISRVESS
jgi:hypothetical protein